MQERGAAFVAAGQNGTRCGIQRVRGLRYAPLVYPEGAMLTFALVVLIILCAWLLIGLSVGNNDESAENTDELKREFGFEQISIKCRGFVSNGDGSYQYCVK